MNRLLARVVRASTIKGRLVRIGLISTGLATLVIGLILLLGVCYQGRERIKEELLIQAAIAGENSTAALSFHDAPGAVEVLTALRAAPSIEGAAIYDADGALFAVFARTPNQLLPPRVPQLAPGYRLGLSQMEVLVPISLNGQRIGSTYLSASFRNFYADLARNALLGLIASTLALGLAILLLLRLQRAVTKPLLALSKLVEQVSRLRDYSVRAEVNGHDEVAILAAGINTMLNRIAERDAALEREIGERKLVEARILKLNETLEERVSERSRQLEAERNFIAEVLNMTSALVLVIDPNGRIASANRAAQLACGRAAQELPQLSMWQLFPDTQQGSEARDACARAGSGVTAALAQVEGDWLGLDGERRRIAWQFTPVPGGRGDAGAPIIATGNDITSQKLVEASLQEAKLAAEEGSRSKSEFLANMSHEMRTPLAGLIGMLDIALRDAALSQNVRQYIELGHSNAQSLLAIINDLLDLSKIEAGKLGLETIDFSLPELVHGVAAMFARRASDSALAFSIELDPALPLFVASDPTRLRQVLVNLLANAFKFTASGAVAVQVALRAREGDVSRVVFCVQDSGIGIPANAQSRLFQKFEQADSSTTRRYGGTGLGLAICRQLVELMGGTIGVDSVPGRGSRFHFELALVDGRAPELATAAPRPAHSHRLRILCAEDFPTNQLIIRTLLEAIGHQVDMVDDGAQAVAACASVDYDLVLMDGRMPVMDGMTAARLIRAGGTVAAPVRDSAVTIAALTANASAEDRSRYLGAGMDDFMSKPLDQDLLHGLISRVIVRQLGRGRSLALLDGPAAPPSIAELDAMFAVPALRRGASGATAPRAPSAGTRGAGTRGAGALPEAVRLRMRDAFSADAPHRLAEIDMALNAHDHDTAGRLLHGIKGSAAYLDEVELGALCRELEQAADRGDLTLVAQAMPRLRVLMAPA